MGDHCALHCHTNRFYWSILSMGLAPMIVEEIFEIVQPLTQDEGVTFLLAEQNAHLVLRCAHYGLVLENGRVAASGPAVELAARDDVSGGARLVLAAGMHQLRQRSPCDKKHQRLQPRGRLSKSQGFKSPLRNRERNLIMSVGSHVESWKRIARDAFAHLNRLLAEPGNSDEDLVFQIRRSQEN